MESAFMHHSSPFRRPYSKIAHFWGLPDETNPFNQVVEGIQNDS